MAGVGRATCSPGVHPTGKLPCYQKGVGLLEVWVRGAPRRPWQWRPRPTGILFGPLRRHPQLRRVSPAM